jgi:transposase-like protein
MQRAGNRLLPSCLTHAHSIDELLPWLYLNGVPLGNGRQLTTQWQSDYAVWNQQTFSGKRYLYWWADGIYPAHNRADVKEPPCVLLLAGVTEHGQTEFIACEAGERQSAETWQELLSGLQQRGLTIPPRLVVGDHTLGIWSALTKLYKETQHQHCWHYATRHALQELDKDLHKPMRTAMRAVWTAPIRLQAEQALYEFLLQYWEYSPKLAERMEHEQQALLQFYDFPNAQRRYLHSADFIRSTFAGVQKQEVAANTFTDDMWPALFYLLAITAEKHWPRLRGFNHLAHIKAPLRAAEPAKPTPAARAAA